MINRSWLGKKKKEKYEMRKQHKNNHPYIDIKGIKNELSGAFSKNEVQLKKLKKEQKKP